MTTPTAPKYRTTARACSCPGFWYRKTCRHYRAYRDAVALVVAQDRGEHWAWDTAKGRSLCGAQKGCLGMGKSTRLHRMPGPTLFDPWAPHIASPTRNTKGKGCPEA